MKYSAELQDFAPSLVLTLLLAAFCNYFPLLRKVLLLCFITELIFLLQSFPLSLVHFTLHRLQCIQENRCSCLPFNTKCF